MQLLEIESAALAREKDKASKKRRDEVQADISNLREDLEPLMEKWESDRGCAEELKNRNANLWHAEHNHPEKTSSSYNRFRGIVEEYESPHDYVPNTFNDERYIKLQA